jgi:hypothetical protein
MNPLYPIIAASAALSCPPPVERKAGHGVDHMRELSRLSRKAKRRGKEFPFPAWGRHHLRKGSPLHQALLRRREESLKTLLRFYQWRDRRANQVKGAA